MSDTRPGGFADEPDRPEAMAGADGRWYSPRSVLQDPPEGEIVLEPTGPDDDDGSPDGPWHDGADAVMKSMVPSKFLRPYLSEGHQSNSPAVLGHYGVTPEPGGMRMQPGGNAHVAEPGDFDRGYLEAGHAAPSPADMVQLNPHYAAGADAYARNRAQDRSEHLMPSQMITSQPASHGRLAVPADMRASAVPAQIVVSASRAAPGEAR